MAILKSGSALPTFSLKNEKGDAKKNSDYVGSWMVLYIYPQDDTPGCTIQGKSFTATAKMFTDLGVKVVGLSPDSVESHQAFCKKFSLNVELLADDGAEFLNDLGVGQSEWKGKMYWNRTTFLVDPKGVIAKVYENVNPTGHEEVLLNDLREIIKTNK